MFDSKIVKQCSGDGQGSCKRCQEKGIWNKLWMCFLYKIDGLDGCYCEDCVKEILSEEKDFTDLVEKQKEWVNGI